MAFTQNCVEYNHNSGWEDRKCSASQFLSVRISQVSKTGVIFRYVSLLTNTARKKTLKYSLHFNIMVFLKYFSFKKEHKIISLFTGYHSDYACSCNDNSCANPSAKTRSLSGCYGKGNVAEMTINTVLDADTCRDMCRVRVDYHCL